MKIAPGDYRFVLVTWTDSAFSPREVDDDEPMDFALMYTAGFLVKDREESVTVAMDRATLDQDHWRSVITIPRENVRSVVALVPEKKRGRRKA